VALEASLATAVLVGPGQEVDRPAVRVDDPYGAFASLLELVLPDPDRLFAPGVHPTAVIAADAEVVQGVAIGAYCVLGAGARVGAGTRLGPHVILGCDSVVGRDCTVHGRVTVREGSAIGDRVILHSGAVIGSDGFGYLPSPEGLRKIPQVGIVEIGDDVEIGANVCIDRATTGRTVIGAGSKIDNQVQIGHNVVLGKHCTLSAQTGIAGSCVLGDRVTAGGQVGIGDHIRIGSNVRLGGQTGVIGDIPEGMSVFGTPALERRESFRLYAALRKLPGLLRRVEQLEGNSSGPDEDREADQE
jgi:UDP-3-O-[3-hydroxymyristoyl] glucosamine N-acyltransferase